MNKCFWTRAAFAFVCCGFLWASTLCVRILTTEHKVYFRDCRHKTGLVICVGSQPDRVFTLRVQATLDPDPSGRRPKCAGAWIFYSCHNWFQSNTKPVGLSLLSTSWCWYFPICLHFTQATTSFQGVISSNFARGLRGNTIKAIVLFGMQDRKQCGLFVHHPQRHQKLSRIWSRQKLPKAEQKVEFLFRMKKLLLLRSGP